MIYYKRLRSMQPTTSKSRHSGPKRGKDCLNKRGSAHKTEA